MGNMMMMMMRFVAQLVVAAFTLCSRGVALLWAVENTALLEV
jgi:hypothetical protein